MLTSTFSLTAISMEQQHARCVLSSFEHNLQSTDWRRAAGIAREPIEAACRNFVAFAEYFRARKIESYVIPALHQCTTTLDSTLSELDGLRAESDKALQSIVAQVAQWGQSGFDTTALLAQMENYCLCLANCITIEDTRLLPTACELLSSDAWFAIGAACLSEDSQHKERAPTDRALHEQCNRPRRWVGSLRKH